jgi:hypothetical protein
VEQQLDCVQTEEASMYRYRRRKKLRRRRATSVAAFSAVLALAVGIPTFAGADQVNNTLNNIGLGSGSGGDGGSTSGSTATPNAGVPPTYTPPLHGTGPHGQGTVGVIDIQPSDTNPYSGDPSDDDPGSGEDVILGQSRGEQNPDGSYDGKVTLLYLFGSPVVQVTSDPSNNGETQHGPLQPLQEQLLDQICEGSDGQLCLTVLKMDSTSTDNSSTNQFQLLGASIGGEEGINADVASSEGNIQGTGDCQTADGKSNVAHVDAGGNPVVDALQSDSTSNSCNGTVTNNSTTLKLGGNDVPIPDAGCPAGTPNTVFDSLSPLLAVVCNADDTNGSQTSAPYGVREALALFALISGDSSLLKVTLGASESHAVTSEAGPGPGPGPGPSGGGTLGAGGKGGGKKGGAGGGAGEGAGGGAGAGAGAAAGAAGAGNGQLAFTGADLLALGMVGAALILGGLALTTAAGRRHRQTV